MRITPFYAALPGHSRDGNDDCGLPRAHFQSPLLHQMQQLESGAGRLLLAVLEIFP